MKSQGERKTSVRVSNEAVRARTGKSWTEWFSILDAAGAKRMSHKQIVAYLTQEYALGGWWCQMATVCYEQARGMREKHEKPGGYEISASRTVPVSLSTLYKAWHDSRSRSHWLSAPIFIRKATANKSMRITWGKAESNVDVNFYAKGKNKSQVVVQHGRLPDAKAAAQMKKYWADSLGLLRDVLAANERE